MKTRTFEEIWQDLEKLKGRTVYTLKVHKRNDIIRVDSSGITRRAVKGKDYPIHQSYFKHAWRIIEKDRRCEIKEGGTFVCACLACLGEVEYSEIPYAIWLTENIHKFGKPVKK